MCLLDCCYQQTEGKGICALQYILLCRIKRTRKCKNVDLRRHCIDGYFYRFFCASLLSLFSNCIQIRLTAHPTPFKAVWDGWWRAERHGYVMWIASIPGRIYVTAGRWKRGSVRRAEAALGTMVDLITGSCADSSRKSAVSLLRRGFCYCAQRWRFQSGWRVWDRELTALLCSLLPFQWLFPIGQAKYWSAKLSSIN